MESQKMGGRSKPFMVQSLPQNPDPL